MSHRLFLGQVAGLGTSDILFADSSSASLLWKQRPVPKMPLYLFVFLSVAYTSSTRSYRRTPPLQKLGKLLGSQVTPLMLARSPKHHMAATAASHRVSLCSWEVLGFEQSDFQRHEWCVSLQPALMKVPFLLCNLRVWQMAFVISID